MRASKKTTIPHLVVSEREPYERGRQIGSVTRDMIRQSIVAYEAIFRDAIRLNWEQVTRKAQQYRDAIWAFDSDVALEIDGIADGAGFARADVLALNCRTELLFGLGAPGESSECTSFYVGPSSTADGHALIGQNWDWRPACGAVKLFVETRQQDGPSVLAFTEAGIVGKFGFNEVGVGLAVNALRSELDQCADGVPFHVLARSAMGVESAEAASARIADATRASSGNFLIGDRSGRAVDLETAPGGTEYVFPRPDSDGVLVHGNHFDCEVPFVDLAPTAAPGSFARVEQFEQSLSTGRGSLGSTELIAALQSHSASTESICRHAVPDEDIHVQTSTLFSWVVDLTERSAVAANGNPCEANYYPIIPQFSVSEPSIADHAHWA